MPDNTDFRRQMLVAYSFPVGLFLVLPYVLLVGPGGPGQLWLSLGWLLALIAPLVLVACLLAPWAGRQLPVSKLPAFVMGAVAAMAPMLMPWFAAFIQRDAGSVVHMVMIWAFFALPASVLGSILFIGGCDRLQQR